MDAQDREARPATRIPENIQYVPILVRDLYERVEVEPVIQEHFRAYSVVMGGVGLEFDVRI